MLMTVALFAIGIGLWTMRRDAKRLAAKHHYASMDAGYRAIRVQSPNDPAWIANWRSSHNLPEGLRVDRASLDAAISLWEESHHHEFLTDYYLRVANQPWRMFCPEPEQPTAISIPTDDSQIAIWWSQTIVPYIEENGLDHPYLYGEYAVLERQAYIHNGAIDLQIPWHELRNIMPVN